MEKKLGTVRSMRSMVWLRSAFSARVYTQTMYNTVYCFWLFICRLYTVLLMCQKARSCEHGFPCRHRRVSLMHSMCSKSSEAKGKDLIWANAGPDSPSHALQGSIVDDASEDVQGRRRTFPARGCNHCQNAAGYLAWAVHISSHLVKIIGTSHELTPKGSQW